MYKNNKSYPTPHKALIFIVIFALAIVIGVSIAIIRRQKSSEPENYYVPVNEENVQEENGVQYVNNQLVVISQSGVSKKQMKKLFSSYKLSIVGYIELMDTYQVRAENSLMLNELETIARQLEESPLVQSAQVDVVWENETNEYRDDPWTSDGTPSSWDNEIWGNNWGVKAINAPYCWDHYDLGPIHVGIIDSMFDPKHEDLRYLLFFNNDIFEIYQRKDEFDFDKEHGTHVAGIIGASHNTVGISGVVEDCYFYSFSVRGFSDFSGNMGVLSAISSAVLSGAKVINYSMGRSNSIVDEMRYRWNFIPDGFGEHNSPYARYKYYYVDLSKESEQALSRLLEKGYDFLFITAAGNKESKYNYDDAMWANEFSFIMEPTLADRIIVVGAAQNNDGLYSIAPFSFRGDRVDVMAPGCDIYSCLPYNEYGLMSGTSQAAPHVTGVCACVWAADPTLTGAEVKRIVVETADIPVQGDCPNMVNMQAAMAKVLPPLPNDDAPIAIQVVPEQTQQPTQSIPTPTEQPLSPPPSTFSLADGTYNVRFYKNKYETKPEGTYATVGIEAFDTYADDFVESLAVGDSIDGVIIEKIDYNKNGNDLWIRINDGTIQLVKLSSATDWVMLYPDLPKFYISEEMDLFFPANAKYLDQLTAVLEAEGDDFDEIPLARIEDFFLKNNYYEEITVTITVENGIIVEALIPYRP